MLFADRLALDTDGDVIAQVLAGNGEAHQDPNSFEEEVSRAPAVLRERRFQLFLAQSGDRTLAQMLLVPAIAPARADRAPGSRGTSCETATIADTPLAMRPMCNVGGRVI